MDPPYIMGHWTDELLDLMVAKLNERLDRRTKPQSEGVSTEALAARSHGMIEVKHGDPSR